MHEITDLTQHLRGQWQLLQVQEQQMAECWRDSTYLRFRRRHWVNWESRLPGLLSTLESLDNVICRAEGATREPD
jgi:hypothetical protein